MLRMMNKYCSNCLRTQRFLDLGDRLVCETCSKHLYNIGAVASAPDAKPPVSAGAGGGETPAPLPSTGGGVASQPPWGREKENRRSSA